MSTPKTTKKPVITKSVTFIGETKESAIDKLFGGDEAPLIKSVGCIHVPETNTYISVVITTKGSEVVNIQAEEPNLRAIAEESAKISFVNLFMGDLNE